MLPRAVLTVLVIGVVTSLPARAFAQDKGPATKPAGALGEVQVRTLRPVTFFYTVRETTMEKIGAVANEAMDAMMKAAVDNKVQIEGPPLFVYHGVTEDPSKPFKVEIGMIVAAGTKEAGAFKVRKLDGIKVAAALYIGPMSGLGSAYGQLFPKVFEAGNQPTDELREYYLYFEGQDSPNNVVWLQVGVK